MIIVLFLPRFMGQNRLSQPSPADTAWVAAMKRIEQTEPGNYNRNFDKSSNYPYQYDRPKDRNYEPKRELFYFDPNTLPSESWVKLGLRDKTIDIILNYLSKGGRFKKPEDLRKIYGLHANEYKRLVPYVRIEPGKESGSYKEFDGNKTFGEKHSPKSYTSRYPVIDINSADTTAFIALPGIGSKLAARIVNFREKLGGFYSIAQLAETFGLPDSTFQKIRQYLKLENLSIKKININTASLDELRTHPYIRWALANPIIAYRKEYGPFVKVDDIKKIMVVTDDIYKKIAPYLTIKN